MKRYLFTYKDYIETVLYGFDRIIIKGHIKYFYHPNYFYYFLAHENIKLKDFKPYVLRVTHKIKEHITQLIATTGCYYEYLRSTKIPNEQIVRQLLN